MSSSTEYVNNGFDFKSVTEFFVATIFFSTKVTMMEIHDVSFHLSDGRKRSEGESSGYWWIEYSRVIIPLR